MGLYLCVFDGDDEVEGVEVGSYADFGLFRATVERELEQSVPGGQFPTLLNHSDSDGVWTVSACESLKRELEVIRHHFKQLPPRQWEDGWQRDVQHALGIEPRNLYESFFDVDGEPLILRMFDLCEISISSGQPIIFQ